MYATGAKTPGFSRSIGKKCIPELRMECCVEGCGAKYGQVDVSFHRFPTIQTARDALRRELWIEAAGLPNDNAIVSNALICGQHFEHGKPSLPTEVRSLNWAPKLKLKARSAVSLVSTSTAIETGVSDSTSTAMNTISPQHLQTPSAPAMGPQLVPKDVYLPAYCRLCLAEDVHMVFPKERKVYQQLAEKLKECLNLVISIGELTNSLICKKCYQTLEHFYQFRTRCTRQSTYLNMRKSLEPNRNQLLRYKDNWYWYSCIGNGMMSVIWGCSVVCCPAFVVSHPSGKICSKYANHQHKQKMEEVKAVYCHGEYIFDGYRYSFEIINANRTLTFSCRSLHDNQRTCQAVLITNDRSEVLAVRGAHNHEREIIIESAVKDGSDNQKRSITIIRGLGQEIVFCQGFWYTTISEHSNISHWNCIRTDCNSTIAMINGIVKFFGKHTHLPVLLKWGAGEDRTMESKGTTLMKVVPPPSSKFVSVQAVSPTASKESTTINHTNSGIASAAPIMAPNGNGLPNMINNSQSTIDDGSLLNTIKVEPNLTTPSNSFNSPAIVKPTVPSSLMPRQPLIISAAAMASKAANNSPNVVVRMNNPIPATKHTNAPTVRVVPSALLMQTTPKFVPPKPSVPVSAPTIPKIVHVMSLNLNHSSNQPKQLTPEATDDSQQVIKQEVMDEPETITDEVQPTMAIAAVMGSDELPKPPPLIPRPMALLSTASVISDNMLSVTTLDPACTDGSMQMALEASTSASYGKAMSYGNVVSSQATATAENEEEFCLSDLQDDEEIPPIVPIDEDLEQGFVRNQFPTRRLPSGKTQVIRKVMPPRNLTADRTGNQRVVHSTQTVQRSSHNPGYSSKSTLSNVSCMVPSRDNSAINSLHREKSVRMYGPSSGSQKRINEGAKPEDSPSKKTKTDEPMPPPPLETTMVDADKYVETDGLDQEQSSAEDPFAVCTEPHQNVQNDDADDENQEEVEKEAEEDDDDDEDGSSCSEATGQKTITENTNSSHAETVVDTSTSIEKPAEQKANSLVPDKPAPKQLETSPNPSLERSSDKKIHSKTVQLVKLQKTEQMLSHEGHLYKIKWHNRRRIYWDCMLREQVNCMAILETQSHNPTLWNKIGSHNHKVPKPIINDENRGRYQMLSNDIVAANVKNLPGQTVHIHDIVEQEGRMMNLAKRKIFNFKIQKRDQSILILCFANYEYSLRGLVGPGFRWRCTKCAKILETDEKFTIAQELGSSPHNHEPKVTVINLDDEGTLVEGRNSIKADASNSSTSNQQQSQQKPAEVVEVNSSDQNKKVDEVSLEKDPIKQTTPDQDAIAIPNLPTARPDSDAEDDLPSNSEEISLGKTMEELHKGVELREDGSDEEEMVLDPSSGELCKRGDLKRKEYRKAILEDIVADDEDDETEYLDPLTGMMRRKGDKSLSEDEPLLEDEEDTEVDENTSHNKTTNMLNEDFEELLNPDSSNSTAPTKLKAAKKNSLAALRMILTLHKQLRMPDSERNFTVISKTDDDTCLIQFQEMIYELHTILPKFSVWKCNLSPQYACRGKVHLSPNYKQISVSGVNHCHVPTLKDMFIERSEEEDGQIKDTDSDSTRKYTFFKRPNHVYQLKLDDGYLYNCITVSKTGVSCWRCVSRQRSNCKAIITMEGDFESMTRNRFSHSHETEASSGAAADAEEEDSVVDSSISPAKRTSRNENENDKKKRKRQTL